MLFFGLWSFISLKLSYCWLNIIVCAISNSILCMLFLGRFELPNDIYFDFGSFACYRVKNTLCLLHVCFLAVSSFLLSQFKFTLFLCQFASCFSLDCLGCYCLLIFTFLIVSPICWALILRNRKYVCSASFIKSEYIMVRVL